MRRDDTAIQSTGQNARRAARGLNRHQQHAGSKRTRPEDGPWASERWPPETGAVRFLGTPARETRPEASPDRQWLAYVSNESGRNEIYVRRFPDASGRVLVSRNGGSEPRRGGRERAVLPAGRLDDGCRDRWTGANASGRILSATSRPSRVAGAIARYIEYTVHAATEDQNVLRNSHGITSKCQCVGMERTRNQCRRTG
jgi:hypothetical protein